MDIDKDAGIVLPKTAEFSDATSKIVYDDVTNDTVGTIEYTYAGHEVVVLVLLVLGIIIKKVADNFYIIKHNFEVRKEHKRLFKREKKRNKRRRRRR